MSTKKLIIITIIAVIGLNLLNEESKKNFNNQVIDAVKQNAGEIKTAIGGQAPENAPVPPQPSEEEQLKKQLADKINVDIGNTPVLGNKNAKIMLIVFSDFQCPFSKRGADTTHTLIQKYGNDLMYVYKNLPLPFHTEAMPAAKLRLQQEDKESFMNITTSFLKSKNN